MFVIPFLIPIPSSNLIPVTLIIYIIHLNQLYATHLYQQMQGLFEEELVADR